ncbi:hypothetical protein RJ639_011776 [Escallonia herrerae]|uniref:DUF4005 domain-containing protein n=1 Tax=Escallonia herrerae TaxID=1293975 RepID=A0AA89ARN6_9ASTE|nr:hypothetical protein RJ639_011776 [Escallonia herrerae]
MTHRVKVEDKSVRKIEITCSQDEIMQPLRVAIFLPLGTSGLAWESSTFLQMGKASKWIRNFLTGKKEEKAKKKDGGFTDESLAIVPATPREKRRWSFGRSARTENAAGVFHKSTRSFDSIVTAQLLAQASLAYENQQKNAMAMAVAVAAVEATKAAVTTRRAPPRKHGPVEHAAATKIQAFFRSYLARKALCALKGLVKIQALVRGHLVRKQTTATVRCMNALMAIQVRARVQRIQTAEDSQLVVKRRSTHRASAHDNQLRATYSEAKSLDINETHGSWKSKTDHMNEPEAETIKHGFGKFHLGNLSTLKRENQYQIYNSPSPRTETSSQSYDRQFEELFLRMAQRNSLHYSTMSNGNYTSADTTSHSDQFERNYMANTESSKAKVRSHSEPKQRPKLSSKQKNRRTASNEGIADIEDAQSQHSSLRSRDSSQKNHHPWLMKLYRSTKSIREIECDSTSTTTNDSSYSKTLISCEVIAKAA